MTAPAVVFDLAAAQQAEDRAENGASPLPGDRELIAALDGWRQQQWDTYWEPIHRAQEAEQTRLWLTQQCGGCEPGGTGEPCVEHFGPDDACIGCDDGTGTVVCDGCQTGGEGGSYR